MKRRLKPFAGVRRRLIILGAFLLATVLAVSFYRREPRYQDKSLSQWIRSLEYANINPTPEQRAALRAMGESAITGLIQKLEHRDSFLKRKLVAYAADNANIHNRFIAPRHVIPEHIIHAQAARALGEIGPAARRAIPALLVASTNRDSTVAERASAALMKIRQDYPAELLKILEDPQSTDWTRAAGIAKFLGTNGHAAVPFLVKALQNTNAIVREAAADALGGIVSHAEISVPALITCVKDETDPGVRRMAIDALCKFEGEKQKIVPVLLAFVKDQDLNVWLGAAFGLEDLLSTEEEESLLVPVLTEALKSPNETIRANAALYLDRINASDNRSR